MTQQERDDVITLGWSKATWTDPPDDEADDPFCRSWASLTMAQQSAATRLGFQHVDFGPAQDEQI